jgi:hypothetical protein
VTAGADTSRPGQRRRPGRSVSLSDYVQRRNGVPLGGRGALRAMLTRSFGARSFAGFWRAWNPIFGYLLGRYVHAPLARILPRSLAVVLTFVVCGAVHDAVTMAVRGAVAFLFTPWFFFLGAGVLVGEWARMDLSAQGRVARALVHFVYLAACLVLALAVDRLLHVD